MTRMLLLFAALLIPSVAHTQGCGQCRETIGQTPSRTQSAYRRAIVLMLVAGGGVFAAGIIAIRRFR